MTKQELLEKFIRDSINNEPEVIFTSIKTSDENENNDK